MSVEISPLDCNHLDQVLVVAESSFPTRWSRQDFAYFLAHDSGFCTGIIVDKKVAAYLIGLLVQGELDIISIATASDYRRRGYAETLLRQLQSEPKIEQITLEVDVSNHAAIALYQKLNFQVAGTRRGYYQQNQDAYRMLWQA